MEERVAAGLLAADRGGRAGRQVEVQQRLRTGPQGMDAGRPHREQRGHDDGTGRRPGERVEHAGHAPQVTGEGLAAVRGRVRIPQPGLQSRGIGVQHPLRRQAGPPPEIRAAQTGDGRHLGRLGHYGGGPDTCRLGPAEDARACPGPPPVGFDRQPGLTEDGPPGPVGRSRHHHGEAHPEVSRLGRRPGRRRPSGRGAGGGSARRARPRSRPRARPG